MSPEPGVKERLQSANAEHCYDGKRQADSRYVWDLDTLLRACP